MTDRGREALQLSGDAMGIGPSALHWDGDRLVVHIDEVATPHGQRVRGTVTLRPSALTEVEMPLTPDGAHVWRPFAPVADIEVAIDRPGWTWRGHGYFDANFGTRALEADFSYWTWGRFPTRDGAACFYDADLRHGPPLSAAIGFDRSGRARALDAPPKARLRRPLWQVRRETRADPGTTPRQVKRMLDAPFYNRSVVRTRINGDAVEGVHEALDLDRFSSDWLMPILALRVPRRRRWPHPVLSPHAPTSI